MNQRQLLSFLCMRTRCATSTRTAKRALDQMQVFPDWQFYQ